MNPKINVSIAVLITKIIHMIPQNAQKTLEIVKIIGELIAQIILNV